MALQLISRVTYLNEKKFALSMNAAKVEPLTVRYQVNKDRKLVVKMPSISVNGKHPNWATVGPGVPVPFCCRGVAILRDLQLLHQISDGLYWHSVVGGKRLSCACLQQSSASCIAHSVS